MSIKKKIRHKEEVLLDIVLEQLYVKDRPKKSLEKRNKTITKRARENTVMCGGQNKISNW